MVAQPIIEYPFSSTPPHRDKRYSCKQNLQGSKNPSSKVTHNKSFEMRKQRAPQLNRSADNKERCSGRTQECIGSVGLC